MARYPWVRQESGEDCAAASLAIVARHYGRALRVSLIRVAMSTGSTGATLSDISSGARQLGFTTRIIEAGSDFLDHLDNSILPAILYWKGYHFVVLFGKENDRYVLSDPGLGIRKVTREELESNWQARITMLLKPHPLKFLMQQDHTINPFRSLFSRILPFRYLVAGILLLALALSLTSLAIPFLAGFLGDMLLAQAGDGDMSLVFIALMALFAFIFVIERAQQSLAHRFDLGFAGRLKSDFGNRLLDLPLTYHQSRGASLVRYRLDDTEHVSSIFTHMVSRLPLSVLTASGSAIFLVTISPSVMALATVLGLSTLAFTLLIRPGAKQASYRFHARSGETFFLLSQFFRVALTIKTLAVGHLLQRELSMKIASETIQNRQEMGAMAAAFSIPGLMINISLILILWFGTSVVVRGHLSFGGLIASTGFAFLFLTNVRAIASFLIAFSEFRVSVQSFEELFDAEPESKVDDEKPWVTLPHRETLVCEGLCFQYPGRTTLFKDLSLAFPGGKVSALIGPSGCGKTTLSHVITRLYVPQEGIVKAGGYDLAHLPLECLRRQILLVLHEARFLNRSVMENLTMVRPEITTDEVVTCCMLAEAHDFISSLPQGYGTMIGDFSAQLSAGEKQRLSIARALVADPPFLIVDEGTSSLDPPTESRILGNLLHRRQGKTTILISHRPMVIERAEWIVFLAHGSLQFEGSMEEFVAAIL